MKGKHLYYFIDQLLCLPSNKLELLLLLGCILLFCASPVKKKKKYQSYSIMIVH